MHLQIRTFKCLTDNIGVLLYDAEGAFCLSVDAPDEAAITQQLHSIGRPLTDILVTHSHIDHIQAIPALRKRFGCRVTVPSRAGQVLPEADRTVSEGDRFEIGRLLFTVWETPGHCADHVSYILFSENIAFVGDVLFTLGCGRVFGGDYEAMFRSVKRLQSLPDEMQLYCGHDYSLSNGRFARAVDPDNERLKQKLTEIEQMSQSGRFMVPTQLGDEKMTNPFLRVSVPEIVRTTGRGATATELEVFTALREWKNEF